MSRGKPWGRPAKRDGILRSHSSLRMTVGGRRSLAALLAMTVGARRTTHDSERYLRLTLRSRSALVMTVTDEKLIAAAAIIGDRTRPNNGYSAPAATGTPTVL